jgi:hypothetical protein
MPIKSQDQVSDTLNNDTPSLKILCRPKDKGVSLLISLIFWGTAHYQCTIILRYYAVPKDKGVVG